MSRLSRREFLRTSAAVALGFRGLYTFLADSARAQGPADPIPFGYGDLIPDPAGLLDLPAGFAYRVISRAGDPMDDGLLVPGLCDGMAAFPGPSGKTILVRNHELIGRGGAFGPGNELLGRIDAARLYDGGRAGGPSAGGTTTLVYDTARGAVESQYLSLGGTVRNCAGGATPWGSWITCEEFPAAAGSFFDGVTLDREHGYNFEVPASVNRGIAAPIPLKAMGRFNHEAVAVHPGTGIVYQTEDRADGLLYRFLPGRAGNLGEGGRLQALKIRGMASADTRNWSQPTIAVGQAMDVEWLDIQNVEAPGDDLRFQGFAAGAARFARGEGMWYGSGSFYFACTNGGSNRTGQIWRYTPSPLEGAADEARQPGRLALFIEPNNSALLENADNVAVSPWGDLILCEDSGDVDYLIGVTPGGETYRFAKNAANTAELAGATFSPDGRTLFFNIFSPGMTLAVTGPWHRPPTHLQARGKQLTTLGRMKRTELLPNYPNPFNPDTWIPYRLARSARVEIRVFSPSGVLVRTLDLGFRPAGEYVDHGSAAYWDGRNATGELVSSGPYFYQMQTENYTATRQLAVRK
jgi:secreted PhoX family phosphatase